MAAFYINRYVIEIKRKSGITEYNFIATPVDWRIAIGYLSGSLNNARLNPRNLPPSTQTHSSNAFSDYATISRGKTSRITVDICVSECLGQQKENPPLRERLQFNTLLLFLLVFTLGFLFAAFTGLVFVICTLLSLFRH